MGNCTSGENEPPKIEEKKVLKKERLLEYISSNLNEVFSEVQKLNKEEDNETIDPSNLDRLLFLRNSLREMTPLLTLIEGSSKLEYYEFKVLFDDLFTNLQPTGNKQNYSITFYKLKDSIESGIELENKKQSENKQSNQTTDKDNTPTPSG
jgi:hypothetical protein